MLWEELSGPRKHVYLLLNNLHALPRPSKSTDKLLSYINKIVRPDVENSSRLPPSTRWFITSRKVDFIDKELDVRGKRHINLTDYKYDEQIKREMDMYVKSGLDRLAKKKSTQWIDDLESLLMHLWQAVLESNADAVLNIKEMLRTLVLAYDEPTDLELAMLAGFALKEEWETKLSDLVRKCKPLLRTREVRVSGFEYTVVGFASAAVKKHLIDHSKELLGLNDEERRL
ncbi:hypothetical protein CDD82_3130 [Ophiocordyceps australis]|uniref:Uncharacterized protein n=1 Tax=Ophiocordyceps australis TaxID=1399860 RepID=A0A2C5ZMF9_9HYPO|nr:hypothetical protein CDD82_3130 [Ophiocordyceps australis]